MAGPRTDSLTAATLALSPGEPSNWQGRRARPGDQWHGACVRVFQVRGTGCHSRDCSAEPVPRTLPVCQLHTDAARTLSRMLVILALPLVTAPSGPRRPRTFVASFFRSLTRIMISTGRTTAGPSRHGGGAAASEAIAGAGGRGPALAFQVRVRLAMRRGPRPAAAQGGPVWLRGCSRCGRALSR